MFPCDRYRHSLGKDNLLPQLFVQPKVKNSFPFLQQIFISTAEATTNKYKSCLLGVMIQNEKTENKENKPIILCRRGKKDHENQELDVCVFKVEVCLEILSTVGMKTIPEQRALKELGEQAMARAGEKEVKATGIKAIACLVSLRNST